MKTHQTYTQKEKEVEPSSPRVSVYISIKIEIGLEAYCKLLAK